MNLVNVNFNVGKVIKIVLLVALQVKNRLHEKNKMYVEI